MSEKIDRKKSKEKHLAQKVSKADEKAMRRARKIQEKALKKAAKEIRVIEKKAKKAAVKEEKMARSVSKKRVKKQAKIKYERHMKREEAAHYFLSLITGLQKGGMQFNQGRDTVVITPAELVDVEIKAETKGKMEKITFEMAWLANKSRDITISTC